MWRKKVNLYFVFLYILLQGKFLLQFALQNSVGIYGLRDLGILRYATEMEGGFGRGVDYVIGRPIF